MFLFIQHKTIYFIKVILFIKEIDLLETVHLFFFFNESQENIKPKGKANKRMGTKVKPIVQQDLNKNKNWPNSFLETALNKVVAVQI
jgi:hypothetical protein